MCQPARITHYFFRMQHINVRTPGESWIAAMLATLSSPHEVMDGKTTLKELLHVTVTVDNPAVEDRIVRELGDPGMLEWMRRNFFGTEPVAGWGYSYGQRIFGTDGRNPISGIIEKLKKNPESKSATIGLMDAEGDALHMPCITTLDFKIRDGRLHTTAFFRSQDAGKKLYADVICLGEIAERVAKGAGVANGPLHLIIASLHAYETDWDRMRLITASSNRLCAASA
jgi:thymidylate synthase